MLYTAMTVDKGALDAPTNCATVVTDAPTFRASAIGSRWKSLRSDIMVDEHNTKTITGLLAIQVDSSRIIGQGEKNVFNVRQCSKNKTSDKGGLLIECSY